MPEVWRVVAVEVPEGPGIAGSRQGGAGHISERNRAAHDPSGVLCSGFLELEVQGPYTSIPAGGSLAWTIAWRIVKIPTSVTVSAGSTTLADFAKQQAAL